MMRSTLIVAFMLFCSAHAATDVNSDFADGLIHDLSDESQDGNEDMIAEQDRRRLAFGDILRLYGALDGRTAGRKYCGDVERYLAMDKDSCMIAAQDLSKAIYRTRCAWVFHDGLLPVIDATATSRMAAADVPAGCVFQLSRTIYAQVNVYWNAQTYPVDAQADAKTCNFHSISTSTDMGHYNARCLCIKCDQAFCYNRAYPPQFSNSLTAVIGGKTVVGTNEYLAVDTPNNYISTVNNGHAHSMIQSWHSGTCDCTCWLNGNYFGRRCNEMNLQFSCSEAVTHHLGINKTGTGAAGQVVDYNANTLPANQLDMAPPAQDAGGVHMWYTYYTTESSTSSGKMYLDRQLLGYYDEVDDCDDYETFAYDKMCWIHGPDKCQKDNCCKDLPIRTCTAFMAGGAGQTMMQGSPGTGLDWINAHPASVGTTVSRTCSNAGNKRLRGDVDACYDLTVSTNTGADVNVPNQCGVNYCCEEIPEVPTCAHTESCSEHGCAQSTGDDWVLDTVQRYWDHTRVCEGKEATPGDAGEQGCSAADCCVDPLTLPSCQRLNEYTFVAATVSQANWFESDGTTPITKYTLTNAAECSAKCTSVSDCEAWSFEQPATTVGAADCQLYRAYSATKQILFQKDDVFKGTSGLRCDSPIHNNSLYYFVANGVCKDPTDTNKILSIAAYHTGQTARWDKSIEVCETYCTNYSATSAKCLGYETKSSVAGGAVDECRLILDSDTNGANGIGTTGDGVADIYCFKRLEKFSKGITATIGWYPNYYATEHTPAFDTSLAPVGTVVVRSKPGTVDALDITWSLTGLQKCSGVGCTTTGSLHIHEGTSCTDKGAGDFVGAHYWNSAYTGMTDPWNDTTVQYTADENGVSKQDIPVTVSNGYTIDENNGRTIVIHTSTATGSVRVGCGVIRPVGTRCMTRNKDTERTESYWTCPPGRELKRKTSGNFLLSTSLFNDVSRCDVLQGCNADALKIENIQAGSWVDQPLTCDGTQTNCDEICCTRDNFCELKDLITVSGSEPWHDAINQRAERHRRIYRTTLDRIAMAKKATEVCEQELIDTQRAADSIIIDIASGDSSPWSSTSFASDDTYGKMVTYFIIFIAAMALAYNL